MIAWLKKTFGRGSRVDLLIRALSDDDLQVIWAYARGIEE